jgi:NAD(P)-dependent dehydrogenase (short-subunit alcohol dehydrogenase family)
LVADRSAYNVLSQPLSLPNVDSIFFVSRHAIPAMVETAGGAIVNVSSSQR